MKIKKNYGQIYTLPILFWITILFVVPMSIILIYSFMKKGLYGGIVWQFTFKAYTDLFNKTFAEIVWQTLFISVITTIITVLIAIPCSYYIARSKYKDMLLFLVIIPFWTNFLIRVYAWISILGNNGIVNNFLLNFGLIDQNLHLLYSKWSIIVIMIYTYIPFAILPLTVFFTQVIESTTL